MKARFYDPDVGRFLNQDSYLGESSTPPSLHRYLYAYGNPTYYIDPDGNETVKEMMGLDDDAVDSAIASGQTSTWDAIAYAGKETFYKTWNFASLGFLERQDDRRYKYDRNQISKEEFYGGTIADAGTSALATAAGGGVASRVAAKLGGGTAATLTGAAAGSGFDNATVQAGQVLTHQATDGRIGQEKVSVGDVALAMTVGVAMKRVSMKGKPKPTAENASGPKKGDSLGAIADAEAGMPYSHPVKAAAPKKINAWNEFQKATKGQFKTRAEAAAVYRANQKAKQNVKPGSVSQKAQHWQGAGNYYGVDKYKDITLKKGTVIYAGEPGFSGYFTTRSGARRAGIGDDLYGGDAQKLFEGLQVGPRAGLNRPGVGVFEVTEDVTVAFGKAKANKQFGKGGLPQIFMPEFEKFTRQLYSKPLSNRSSRIKRQ